MKSLIRTAFVFVSLLCSVALWSQQPPSNVSPSPGPAPSGSNIVPRLVKFSGVANDDAGKPLSGTVAGTFSLYSEQQGGEPLWTETQSLQPDAGGRYSVLLGATQAEGLPAEMFTSGEARWLGAQIQGQPEQPRTLLVSVPYAITAVEAEKLGGKSVSDFVLSESLGDQVRQVIQAQSENAGQATSTGLLQQGQTKANTTSSPQVAASGPKFPPSTFSGTTASQIVLVQQHGIGNGLYAQTASTTGAGVVGENLGTGAGVFGNGGASGTGVTGVTNSPGGNAVFGFTSAPGAFGVIGVSPTSAGTVGVSQSNNGVYGQVYGEGLAFGSGVFGDAVGTTGFTIGAYGQSASTSGSGVDGVALAASGYTSGVYGQSFSSTGTGVFGSTVQWVGVGGRATAPSGGPAFGVWGDSLSTGGVGVAGFEDATSGYTNGVMGTSVSPNGNGIVGVNNSNYGNYNNAVLGINNGTSGNAYGVAGQTATTGFGAGVIGTAFATSGTPFGVFGQSASPNAVAVFGHSIASAGGVGVEGWTEGPNAAAGVFVAHAGSGLILQGVSGSGFNTVFSVDAAGNLNISGNLHVAGSKSSTVQLKNGREVALYAVESPENWFEDFGNAALTSGVAWVPLDASFAEATNAAITYHVFLTPNGDSNGLYVARKTAAGFEVREHGGATSSVAFDYRIVARRRGYETVRMAEVARDVKTVEASRQRLAELANSGNLGKVGRVEVPRIVPPPAIRPIPPRPSIPKPPAPNVPQAPRVQ